MAGESNYIQVPPDSTGKKVDHNVSFRIRYNNTTSFIFEVGQTGLLVGTNNITFTINKVEDSSEYFIASFTDNDIYNGTLPSVNDTILVGGITRALVISSESIYVPVTQIKGGANTASVDATGSINMRFSEGLPQLDAFGRLRVSQGTALGEYVFSKDTKPFDFSNTIVGNGSISHDSNLSAAVLSCPSGVPADGTIDDYLGFDQITQTSNTYHHYFPGFSQTAIMTVALGDSGKDGCTRNWGYFEKYNGYMFRVDDATGGLKVVVRSSHTGSTVDQVFTSADFNGDPVDGTGSSQFTLDVQDDNIYWLDIQWLGSGRVRFGTYYRGQRIVIHEYYHENNGGAPHSQTGSLPVCVSMKNTQTQLSETTIAVWCMAVHTEHTVDLQSIGSFKSTKMEKTFDPTNLLQGLSEELIGVITPIKNINGAQNRNIYVPRSLDIIAYHPDGSNAMLDVSIRINPIIGGGSKSLSIEQSQITDASAPYFNSIDPNNPFSTALQYVQGQSDNSKLGDAVFYGGGVTGGSSFVHGQAKEDLSGRPFNLQEGGFKNMAELGGKAQCFLVSVTPSPDGVTPTIIEIDTTAHPSHNIREGYELRVSDILGTVGTDAVDGLNYDNIRDNKYYLKLTGVATAELYEDIEFNTPVITQGLSYSSSGTLNSVAGSGPLFAITARPLQPSIDKATNITIQWSIGWAEIAQ